ncbi:concanavalin A-like lectin/glucanase domain-containing protein, partial [Mycena pura]
PAPLSFAALPPRAPFAAAAATTTDSEPPSPTATGSRGPSPPVTPRSLSFLTPPIQSANRDPFNPSPSHGSSPSLGSIPPHHSFSPPPSVRSFSAVGGAESPAAGAYPFPSPDSTRASSMVDVRNSMLPRAFSAYSMGGERGSFSRPTTGDSQYRMSASSNNLAPGTGTATPRREREAFASPPARPLTISATPNTARLRPSRKGGRPTLVTALDKPWIGEKDPYARIAYWITYLMILLGVGVGVVRCYTVWTGTLLFEGNLCPVMIEDFSNKTTEQLFGTGVAGEGGTFFREVDASGFGNGEFEMTTNSDSNSFVHNGQLYLVPTLTSDVIPQANILDGAVYNLTGCTYNITHSTGYTTSGHGSAGINTTEGEQSGGGILPDAPFDLPAYLSACSAYSNATQGKILPPVMSARVSTRRSASLKFGRVEVVAKLPTGDWLWPAIWMLPVDSAYGGWPLSGEIDIMEARGNGPSYPKQGVNYVRSSLNWGPATFLNAVAKTFGWKTLRRGRYDDGFHTYALEWDEHMIRMYVDSRLQHMFELRLSKSFWNYGDFPPVVQNGTASVVLENPWVNGTKAAPFDQPFYLIMNVAVGGTNGWFPDGPEKPWLDGSATAPRDFLQAQNKWYPSWPQNLFNRAMVVDSVKMWEKC